MPGERIEILTVSLNSGSNGNATIVRTHGTTLLVDAGLSGKRVQQRMGEAGLDFREIDAILVTHEHTDHISGVGVIARRLKVPVFMTEGTAALADRLGKVEDLRIIEPNEDFEFGDFHIQPFSVSHDAAEPVGYLMQANSTSVGICTDLGVVPHYIVEMLHNVDVLFFETNHDRNMMINDPYPVDDPRRYSEELKKRILGAQGHLSNDDAANALLDIIGERTRHVLLSHLSANYNAPERAYHTVRGVLRKFHINTAIHLTSRQGVSDIIKI